MKQFKIILCVVFVALSVVFGCVWAQSKARADREAPRFRDSGTPLSVSVNATEKELCAGLTAYDGVDGDLTDRIKVRSISQLIGVNSAQVTYVVFDAASNFSTYTRTVYYTDYEQPHFRLTKPLVYRVNEPITLIADGRLSAYDVIDGDISDKIRLSAPSPIRTAAGTYKIRVIVSNSFGDTATVPLTVTVLEEKASDPTLTLTDYLLYIDGSRALDPLDYLQEITDPADGGSQPLTTDRLQIHSDINYAAVGVYEIRYVYTSPSGATATATLTVVVE